MLDIHTALKMGEIEARFPFIKNVLFKKFHLGGCASCSYSPDESISKVAEKHNKDADEIVNVIQQSIDSLHNSFISPLELKEILDKQSSKLLVDVREDWEVSLCQIPGSIVLSGENVDSIISIAKQTENVIVICHHGLRALNATLYLQDSGVPHAKCLKGGIDAFAKEIDSLLPRY